MATTASCLLSGGLSEATFHQIPQYKNSPQPQGRKDSATVCGSGWQYPGNNESRMNNGWAKFPSQWVEALGVLAAHGMLGHQARILVRGLLMKNRGVTPKTLNYNCYLFALIYIRKNILG